MKTIARATGSTSAVAVFYLAVTVVMTWPLAAGLGRDVPWDLGDSVLNCWILGWNTDHLFRALTGDVGALDGFWNANIFFPEPLTFAYSEHLTAQAIQILPVQAIAGNLVLSFDLLFLSTFVLSALGVYLLVRELTGRPGAATAAGLLYGFAPYRIPQFSHLQVLSSQWMPFVLLGLRRYFDTGRVAPLAGAAAALLAQHLSCGYYMLFFTPFVGLYVLYELADRGRLADWRTWASLGTAGAIVALATWPFVEPYLALRALGNVPRGPGEVEFFSGDVYSYLTPHEGQRVWKPLSRNFPKPEGELFPGALPVLLALAGAVGHAREVWRRRVAGRAIADDWLAALARRAGLSGRHAGWIQRALVVGLALSLAVQLAGAAILLAGYGGLFRLGPLTFRVRRLPRALRAAALALAALLVVSPRARAFVRGLPQSAVAYYVLAAVLAFVLSLGPTVRTHGEELMVGPYALLYSYVPGFDGLRVPARLAMLVALFLSVVGGIGLAHLDRLRRGGWIVAALGLIFLVEATPAPIEVNGRGNETRVATPEARLHTGDKAPAVFNFIRQLPRDAVIVHFPFGYASYEVLYMYYSTWHWRELLNGYSGGFPSSYMKRRALFARPQDHPEEAWRELTSSGATHAIVHADAFLGTDGEAVRAWLERRGARLVASFGPDTVLSLP